MSGLSVAAGPWEARANAYGVWFVYSGAGAPDYPLVCGGNNHDTLTEANARLIAAAPELLSSLQYAVKLLNALPGFRGTAQVERMEAAIAKAVSDGEMVS